jgi:hypothetical protein
MHSESLLLLGLVWRKAEQFMSESTTYRALYSGVYWKPVIIHIISFSRWEQHSSCLLITVQHNEEDWRPVTACLPNSECFTSVANIVLSIFWPYWKRQDAAKVSTFQVSFRMTNWRHFCQISLESLGLGLLFSHLFISRVKFSPRTPWERMRECRYTPLLLNFSLDGGDWSILSPGWFNNMLDGPQNLSGMLGVENFSSPYGKSKHTSMVVQPVV